MRKETLEALKSRRAIRKYKPQQIKDSELDAVLEAGTYAPTGFGAQEVKIIAVQNAEDCETLERLNARVMNSDNKPYYGAPTIILVFAREECKNPELDGAAVCTNMLNAAHAVGLGSCWINRCRQMFESDEGRALLEKWGVTEPLTGIASMSLGYADCEPPKAKPRREDYVLKIK